jgi:hypothetical protein
MQFDVFSVSALLPPLQPLTGRVDPMRIYRMAPPALHCLPSNLLRGLLRLCISLPVGIGMEPIFRPENKEG